MKQGTQYEILAQQVYQILLDCEWPGKNICVQHDINLTGSSGQEHQIDVYWEYELAGIKHKVAIECKEYSKPVPIGKVRDFYGVLADLKDVKGIMIASNGFQKGAIDFALSYGINLKELSTSDEVPVLAEIVLSFHLARRRHLFLIDEKWAKEIKFDLEAFRERLSLLSMNGEEWLNTTHLPLPTTGSDIVDIDGNRISSIEELDESIGKKIIGGQEHIFKFDDAYVLSKFGLIKINEVLIFDIEENHSDTLMFVAEGCVKAILKDAIDRKIQNILCPK